MSQYPDRRHAGRVLAAELDRYARRRDVIVLALQRGGVPVGYEVARRLGARLDVFIVRKLGFPGHEELAMGAIASGGVTVLSRDLIERFGVPESAVAAAIAREQRELARRERAFRGDRPPLEVAGKIVILVDDGLATGSTMRAAVLAVRRLLPSEIVVAVPVGAAETCRALNELADEVVCAMTPEPFTAVGLWYEQFDQTTDEEVQRLLAAAALPARVPRSA